MKISNTFIDGYVLHVHQLGLPRNLKLRKHLLRQTIDHNVIPLELNIVYLSWDDDQNILLDDGSKLIK